MKQGKKLVFLLQEEELMNDDVLVYLAEFIQSGFVWNLFSSEQQITIINSVRSEVTQAGLAYTKETAWKFFLE
jgi:dynein heavy chain, axonemal